MIDEHSRRVPPISSLWTVVLATLALMAAVGCRGAGRGSPPVPSPTPTVAVGGGQPASGDAAAGPARGPVDVPAADATGPSPAGEDPTQYFTQCGDSVVSLADVVVPIIDDLVSQGNTSGTGEPGIPYTQDPANELRDCSGNFLRVSSAVAAKCPNHADALVIAAGVRPWTPGGDNAFTGTIRARDSRSTARWYHDKGLFTPIFCDGDTATLSADMAADADKIRPGAVIWYAHTDECITRADGLEKLLGRIDHVGTVRSVARDESGTVVSYEVYHGRRTGMGSGVDTLVRVYTGLTPGIPPYGNWKEPVVGIAPILPTTHPAGP